MADEPAPAADEGFGKEIEPPPRVPISFWIMVGLAAVYTGWRLIQLAGRAIDWLVG